MTLRTEFTEYDLREYLQRRNDWLDEVYAAGLLTDQPVPDSLTVSGHFWSKLVMTGYPLAYANDDAVAR
jgi:hypothetical protein